MEPIRIPASEFKARCLALLDEVARTRESVIVTKHGRPVAKVVPLDDLPTPTMGSVSLLAKADEAYYSTGATWDTLRGED